MGFRLCQHCWLLVIWFFHLVSIINGKNIDFWNILQYAVPWYFVVGTYRIWDLKSQSSLLRIASTPSIELLPFHSGVAHSDAVMSLKWSPHVTDKFATASRDRSFAIWDLKNRHCPFYKSPGQMSLSLCWLPFNFCVLQGMEDCYS